MKKDNKSVKNTEGVLTAEEKRLQSIAAKKQQYKSHKNAIKFALTNLDVKTNKKVIFNDEHSDLEVTEKEIPLKNGHSSKKQSLFDDDENESEGEYNFEIKEQFQGKKGKKLLELQSKYKNDKRFMLDERFLEDNDNLNSDNEDVVRKDVVENDLVQEKQDDLTVLEEILGTKINRDKEKVKKSSKKSMVRYDPSKPEQANLEVQITTEVKPPKKKKHKEIQEKNEEEVKEVPGTFYEVKDDLKESLQETQPFSLLNMFGRSDPESNEVEKKKRGRDEEECVETKSVVNNKNPFRYDSSDNESDGDIEKNDKEEVVNEEVKDDTKNDDRKRINLGPRKFWTDPFFFKNDDYRIQEGFDFIKKFDIEEADFSTVRRNIKEIVKAKVKHNQKKNKMFKKKLGGKKLIKMKKALKRR
nr:probable RNA-binding protein CG14230 [Onthophagus taurus]